MDTDPRRGGHGGAVRISALLACATVVLAGCGSMPVTGDVKAVDASQPGDSQVQVYAVAPREGATPIEVVDGFLESMTSDDPAFRTTRKYLTREAARTWKPSEGTTVLAKAPNRNGPSLHDNELKSTTTTSYTLTGEKVAAVDAQSSYRPLAPTNYSESVHLVQEKGRDGNKEWRIDVVPDGLVLGQSDFKRLYRSVNKYYFAAGRTNGRSTLVADPVYVRNRTDPATGMDAATQTVRTLLAGPTDWLRPVVDSRFPAGTALRKGVLSLAPDDQNVLKVRLNQKADGAGRAACRMMAAQVFFTLRDLSSARVEQVDLQGDRGRLCSLRASEAEEFVSDNGSSAADSQYFVDAEGHVQRIPGGTKGSGTPGPVTGPLGGGPVAMSAVGVARDEQQAAAVSQNGQDLYVSSLVLDEELAAPVVTSTAVKATDRLSAPSWDGRGDLWVADRNPARPRLLRLVGGGGEPQEVAVPGLDGVRIEALRMSADGVRIALLVREDGHTTLKIGRVERAGTGAEQRVSVQDLRQAAPQLTDVSAISWSGRSRLVVVGKEEGGVQQVRYVQADGSTFASGALPGVNQVTAVAAADDEQLPLMAETESDGMVRLSPGDNWQTVLEEGSSLVYPG